jgi:hypothetical protein
MPSRRAFPRQHLFLYPVSAAALVSIIFWSHIHYGSASQAEPLNPQHELARLLAAVSGERIQADVRRLSDPVFNGRQTGTSDDLRTALYTVERFRSLGLRPAGMEAVGASPEQWLMTEQVTSTHLADHPSLDLQDSSDVIPARLGEDYLPVLDSPSVKLLAPVSFAGYGISDRAAGLDEYDGLDVRDKIVLFLRGQPEGYPRHISHADKVRTAREKGVIAFLTATGPILTAYETRRGTSALPVAYYGKTTPGATATMLPGAWISTGLAEQILGRSGRSLRQRQEALNQALLSQSTATEVKAQLQWDSRQEPGRLANVLGLMPAAHADKPSVRPETVIVGAHRDHFGRQAGLLFPGADDNASGTAVMLEVARLLSQSGMPSRRAILFISFSGEEQGLLGSRLYVSRSSRPLKETIAMLNIDHAGAGNGRLTVGVTDLSSTFATVAAASAGLSEKVDVFGFFPGGDHVPFKEAGVPTITIVSGGVHPHFHRSTDTAQTVNREILETAARYLLTVTWQLAHRP